MSCLVQLSPALQADGVDESVAAGCLSLVGILGIASKIGSGMLADKYGAKRTRYQVLPLTARAAALREACENLREHV